MRLYRLLSGPDDDAFCERVERLLNKGWTLHGASAATWNGESVIVVQAIAKEAEGEYPGFIHLRDLHPKK